MKQQLGLVYAPSYLGREAWQRQLDVIRAAVKHLTAKEVAFELDIGATVLSDALSESQRKVWHAHYTHVLKAMLAARHDDDVAADLLRQIVDLDVVTTSYAITDDIELTPEEEAAAYRRALLKFGDAGKAEVDRIRKRGRR